MAIGTYDDTYQLTRERRSGTDSYDVTYTYDPVGNRLVQNDSGTLTTYTYDAANQIEIETTGSDVTTYLCKGQAGSCFEFTGYGFCLPLGLAG